MLTKRRRGLMRGFRLVALGALLTQVVGCGGLDFLSGSQRSNRRVRQDPSPVISDLGGIVTAIVKGGNLDAQLVRASQNSAIRGASVLFAPRSFVLDSDVSLEEGANLLTPGLSQALGITSNLTPVSPTVLVSDNYDMDAAAPFTVAIPVSAAAISAAGGAKHVVVVYKVKAVDEGGAIEVGVMGPDELQIGDGYVRVPSWYFGAFQVASSAVLPPPQRVKRKVQEPILGASGRAVLQPHVTRPLPPSAQNAIPVVGRALILQGPGPRTNAKTLDVVVGGAVRTYRYRFGPDSTTFCADDTGYSAERLTSQPIRDDISTLADGSYVLCILGRTATGIWQSSHQATLLRWDIDRTGPQGHVLKAVNTATDGTVTVSWSPAMETGPVDYELRVVDASKDCAKPVRSYTTKATTQVVDANLPPGRYYLCLFARDDLGNQALGANPNNLYFDVLPVVQIAYFRSGDGANSAGNGKQLWYGKRASTGHWDQTQIGANLGFDGRSSLQLDSKDSPHLVYRFTSDDRLGGTRWSLGHAHLDASGKWQTDTLSPGSDSDGLGNKAVLTIDSANSLHVVDWASRGDKNVLEAGAGGPIEPGSQATYGDMALATGSDNSLGLAYIKDGKIAFRRFKNGVWSEPQTLSDSACQSDDGAGIAQLSLALDAQGAAHLAYPCTAQHQQQKLCLIRYATNVSGSWTYASVATADGNDACSPFTPIRPSLAVDHDGKAYVAFVQNSQQGEDTTAQIALATNTGRGGGAFTLSLLPDRGVSAGYPVLALDANHNAYVAYLVNAGDSDTLKLATNLGGADWIVEEVVKAKDNAPIELDDIALNGQIGRSNR